MANEHAITFNNRVDDNGAAVTLTAGHANNRVYLAGTQNATYTLALNATVELPVGTRVELVRNSGTNTLTVAGGPVTAFRNYQRASSVKVWSRCVLTKTGTDEWSLSGDITPT